MQLKQLKENSINVYAIYNFSPQNSFELYYTDCSHYPVPTPTTVQAWVPRSVPSVCLSVCLSVYKTTEDIST